MAGKSNFSLTLYTTFIQISIKFLFHFIQIAIYTLYTLTLYVTLGPGDAATE